MHKKSISLILVIVFGLTLVFSGCSFKSKQNEAPINDGKVAEKIIVTDALGREVEITGKAKRVIAIGPGALRLCCYFQNIDLVVGIEQMDKDSSLGRPYLMANPSLAELPVIGPGGPNNAPDPEKILAVKPDVIFSTYGADQATPDKLQSKTGIPVVTISYGKTATFDPILYNSLRIIGKVIGMEQKAEEIVGFMQKCVNDLDSRTKDIPEDEKPSVYIGALSMKGAHGIESTQGNYTLFNALHAKNVVDETGKTGSLMIDREKLIQWNPDKIFIDQGGLPIVQQDFEKSSDYYNTLAAFKNGEVYSTLPYNYYTTNIDTTMSNVYYMGKIIYPEKFEDIDPVKKADGIYKFLLGKELYSQMAKDYGGFMKVTLE